MQFEQNGIIQSESGILEKDGIFFHTSSAFAQEHLFYPMWGADYLCAAPYHVERQDFNAFLLFYIRSGDMRFAYRGQHFTAKTGDVILLNCKYFHYYEASQPVRFFWFHFHGAFSEVYVERLWSLHGSHFQKQLALERYFIEIHQMLRSGRGDDDVFSVRIHHMLTLLMIPAKPSRHISSAILTAKEFIDCHFKEDISVDDMAMQAALSRYHFSRIFHAETGISPHAYLIEVRISHAKQLLSESNLTIEEIASECAFCSSSNFIRTFRNETGMTPLKFRQLF